MTENKAYEIQKLNVALMNRELHKSGLSPMNHDVWYRKGWFYIDSDHAQHRPDLTAEAKELYSQGVRAVSGGKTLHSSRGNTYFLPDV